MIKPYTELSFDYLRKLGNIPSVVKRKEGRLLNIESAFDIETTSTYVDGEKAAFMYVWMFGIGYGNDVFYGRTWGEFKQCIQTLVTHFDLGEENRLIIYVHNLPYEFQFIRKHFNWVKVFAMDERKAIKALTTDGIEFRDSLILSGLSLALTAKNLVEHKVKKLEGDLDYSLPRHFNTPLTEKELGYCENDIVVILAYIKEQIKFCGGSIGDIPMTNTGRVRKYVKAKCFPEYIDDKGNKKKSTADYSRMMKRMRLTPDTYTMSKLAFSGGFTHSNPTHTGKVLENVSSLDLTSSYPTVMVAEMFPMGNPVILKPENIEQLVKMQQKYCIMLRARFIGLKNRVGYESYLSESKCTILKGAVTANGRVFSADEAITILTDVDLDIMSIVYSWESIEWDNVTGFAKGYLPKPIIESILDLYEKKTTLKGVDGQEAEYLVAKGMINSIYGMCVTDIVKDEHQYEYEWTIEPANLAEKIDKYNSDRGRFLYYPWGVWVTAYARLNLWRAIVEAGDDYVYSDTDSVKLFNYENHKNFFEAYNVEIIEKCKACLDHYKLDVSKLTPKTIKGVEKPLGVWDFEGLYTRFKTLGAKRYLVEMDGELYLTVAGLSKRNGLEHLKAISGHDNGLVFEQFSDGLHVSSVHTGKLTHSYLDEEQTFLFTDYKGQTEEITVLSSVHLEPAEFTLSVADGFKQFIRNLLSGVISHHIGPN